MVTRQRSSRLFAAGVLGGAVIVILTWLVLRGDNPRLPWQDPPTAQVSTQPSPAVGAPAARATPTGETVTASAPAAPAVPISASTCPPQPAVPLNTAQSDGAFALEAALDTKPLPSASAFIAVGREAAQQGRPRDAEVAFIAACHVAEKQGGSHTAPIADAKAQLGEHYMAAAARHPGDETGQALFQRATALFSESADAYAVALGKNASRTRLAEQRLAAVRTGSLNEAAARMPAPIQDSTVMGASRPSMVVDEDARANIRAMISADPELAQLESDIGRLQAQASRVTRDPAGLRTRDAEAQARRDAQCSDKQCLVRWYAQRRSQLLNEF
ncbi:MAG: hypothetical protein K0Q43_5180 [Ramlibacter sp.]|jgi:hypothetical protein|nr:hypothetical protein [Ramlibacter sp.]MDF2466945.1 hypothetical protein [Ramlibacter sp.]